MSAREVPVKKYVVCLSGEEREQFNAMIRKGKSSAQREQCPEFGNAAGKGRAALLIARPRIREREQNRNWQPHLCRSRRRWP